MNSTSIFPRCPITPVRENDPILGRFPRPRTPFATPEQRAAGLAKARENRLRRAGSLRSDFHPDDEREWAELAAAAGIKLPPYGVPCTPGKMRSWLARLGISVKQYLAWDGGKRLADFATRNPTWPLKAWLGLLLEARADGKFGVATPPPDGA